MKRPSILSLCSAAVVFMFGTISAGAAPIIEFEDWGTGFSMNNPLTCSGAPCMMMDSETNISPTSMVDRTAILNEISGSGDVIARTLSAGPGCATDPSEGCLFFHQSDGTVGTLTLDYHFHFATPMEMNTIGIKVLNTIGSDPFDVAAYVFDNATKSFKFEDSYAVPADGKTHTAVFEFPSGTTTATDLRLVYNDNENHVHVTSQITAELCCAMTNVPEPETLSSVASTSLFLFLGYGALGLIRSLRRKVKRAF